MSTEGHQEAMHKLLDADPVNADPWPMPAGTYWPLLTEITPIPWWRRVWWKLFGRCDE